VYLLVPALTTQSLAGRVTQLATMQALQVAGRCGHASQHKDILSTILATAETFDTVDSVAADMRLFLEQDVEGPAVITAISKHNASLGRNVLAQVVDDISCMDSKDPRVSGLKDYLLEMAKRYDPRQASLNTLLLLHAVIS
jgi:hypothetical protein